MQPSEKKEMSHNFKMEHTNKMLFKIHIEIIPLHGLKKYFSYNHLTDHTRLFSCKVIQIKYVVFQKHTEFIMCKLFQIIMCYVLGQQRTHNV